MVNPIPYPLTGMTPQETPNNTPIYTLLPLSGRVGESQIKQGIINKQL